MSLQLPRDRLSVPLTRHLLRAAADELGMLEEDADAVELAVSEACTNVVSHAGPGDLYEVTFSIGPAGCEIRVVDYGRGFDHANFSPEMAAHGAEHGRGLALIEALVDRVQFDSQPERGTIVHLVKEVEYRPRVAARRLMEGSVRSGRTSPGAHTSG